jgi:hypothetical protein
MALEKVEGRLPRSWESGPDTTVETARPAQLDEGIVSHGGDCGCCAAGDRRDALDRLQVQEDHRRVCTALHRLGADLTRYYSRRVAA